MLGRFEDAALTAVGHACFGVPVEGKALVDAWRSGGAPAYWHERLAAVDRVAPAILPMVHYNYAVVLTRLGRHDEAIAHLTALVDAQLGSVVFLAIEPALAGLARPPRLRRAAHADWGAPSAHGFSTAYNVAVIGAGTPRRAARRTTDPCSCSTSMRFPWARSISSDDRIDPGMPAT